MIVRGKPTGPDAVRTMGFGHVHHPEPDRRVAPRISLLRAQDGEVRPPLRERIESYLSLADEAEAEERLRRLLAAGHDASDILAAVTAAPPAAPG